MRILHTSDWHIGKRLMNRTRLEEQKDVLDEIARICENEAVELVLVAGDVFDTYTPGAEAEELFFSAVKKLAANGRAVLIISGNHDDGVRLSAAAPLAEELGIYIVGNDRKPLPIGRKDGLAYPVASEKGCAVFENRRGERVFVSMLPYPNEARFKEEKSELPYKEQMLQWIDEGQRCNTEGLPSVLLAHIYVLGGAASEGEREIDLGGARAVPAEALPPCAYIALGHLHKKQHMGKGDCYYSGSPLQYAFDEKPDKSVKVFDLTKDGVTGLKDVALQSGKRLVRLEADGAQAALDLLDAYPDRLVEMRLLLSEPLTAAETAALAEKSNLVSLLPEVRSETEFEFVSRKGMSGTELFEAYYRANYGESPSEELLHLFLTTLSENDERK